MPNFIEIGGGSRKFSKKLVDLTRNDPPAIPTILILAGVSGSTFFINNHVNIALMYIVFVGQINESSDSDSGFFYVM